MTSPTLRFFAPQELRDEIDAFGGAAREDDFVGDLALMNFAARARAAS